MDLPKEPAPLELSWLVGAGAVLVCLTALAQRWDGQHGWLEADGTFYYKVSRHLLDTLSLEQHATQAPSWYDGSLPWTRKVDIAWSNVSLGADGRSWWPKHPWLLPVLAAPFVMLYGPYGALLFNCLCLVLSLVLAYRLASRIAPSPAAAAAALLVGAVPFVSGQAYLFSNELLVSLLVLAACDRQAAGRPLAAGLLVGLACLAKATCAPFVLALALPLLVRRDGEARRPRLVRYAAGAGGPLALLAASNWWMFGAPWTFSYSRVLTMDRGALAIVDVSDAFDVPLARGLGTLAAGPDGLFTKLSFVAVAAVAGLALLAVRRPRTAAMLALLLAIPVAMHAGYRWYRLPFLDPTILLGVVPLAALFAPLSPRAVALEAWASLGPALAPLSTRLRLAAAAALLPAAALHLDSFIRSALPFDAYEHVEAARVHLADAACDFFNVQVERWECSGEDRGAASFTGRALGSVSVRGHAARRTLWLAAPAGRPRTMAWDGVPLGAALEVELAVPDGVDGAGPVRATIRAGDASLELDVARGDGWVPRTLPTTPGAADLQIETLGANGSARAVVARVHVR